jgi:hypothetical protein
MTVSGRLLVLCVVCASAASAQSLGVPQEPRPTLVSARDYEEMRLSRIATAVRTTEPISVNGLLDEPSWERAAPAGDFIQRRPRTGEPTTERTEVRFLYDDDNLYIGVVCFDSQADRIIANSLQKDYQTNESDGITILIDSLHDRRSGFTFVANPAGAKRDVQLSNNGSGNVDWDGVWDVKTSTNREGWIAEYVIPFKTLRFSGALSQEWGLQITRRIARKNEEADWSPIPLPFGNWRMSLAGTLTGLENIRQGRNLKVKPFVSTRFTERGNAYDGGLDVKYGLTPSLTLDATYRTDFAQVEVDQQQVNLTRFNLFFPEKRDFFLENSGTFGFGPGTAGGGGGGANLVPFFSRRIGLSAAGTPIPILGGTRVSGQINRYDVGLLAMRTEQLDATPANSFLVGRVKRNLWTSSWIGGLVTDRDSTRAGDFNRVAGADAHLQFFGKLDVDTYLLGSETPGRSGHNLARRLQAGWTEEEFLASAEFNDVQPNFNPEVGFIRRRDMEQYSTEVAWQPLLRQSDLIRNFKVGTTLDYYEGSGSGEIETRVNETTVGVVFESNANANVIVNRTFDRLNSALRIPAGNPHVSIPTGDYTFDFYSWQFSTNQRRRFSGSGTVGWGEFYAGERQQLTAALTFKPNYHLSVNLTYDQNDVDVPQGAFRTQLVGAKVIYGFSPRAFLNAFLQYNADTHLISSNIRFDLIHRPLSDLYIVYNDTRDTALGQLHERAFIVKVTNLFNF